MLPRRSKNALHIPSELLSIQLSVSIPLQNTTWATVSVQMHFNGSSKYFWKGYNFSSQNSFLGCVVLMIECVVASVYAFHHSMSLFLCSLNQPVTLSIMPFGLDVLISEQKRLFPSKWIYFTVKWGNMSECVLIGNYHSYGGVVHDETCGYSG